MLKQLSEKEEQLITLFFNPKCFAETLFTEGSPDSWLTGGETINVRLYQIPFLQHDSVLVDDNRLSKQENFDRRKMAGEILLICSRLIGKTYISLGINILAKLVQNTGKQITAAAYDLKHLKNYLDKTCNIFESHPFFKKFKRSMKRGNPDYEIKCKNDMELVSVNTNVKGKEPGKAFWGSHANYHFHDEYQQEVEASEQPRIDAISELGCINCYAGIPLCTKNSPLGKKLGDVKYCKKHLVRLPQYVNKTFTEEKKIERIKQYGSQESVGFKTNVEAIMVEGAQGAFDMEKVRACYVSGKTIKLFELTPDNYNDFERILIIEPLKNASKTFIHVDVGDSTNTEICITYKIGKKYFYTYRITTFRLSLTKQLPNLLKWIFDKVKADYLGPDCSTMGKAVWERMVDLIPPIEKDGKKIDRVIWTSFSQNMITGFEKDENGNIKRDDKGNPLEKREHTMVFTVQKLKELFFDKLFVIPEDDYAFDEQFSNYLELVSGNRISYDTATECHIVQAFEVLAKMIWDTEFLAEENPNQETESQEVVGFFGLNKKEKS